MTSLTMLVPIVFALFLFGTVSATTPGKLPDGVVRCHRSDPNLDSCLKKAIQVSVPIFMAGIPKLNLFPLDPLLLSVLDIGRGNGPVSVDLNFRNLTIYGLKNVVITDVKNNLPNNYIEIFGVFTQPLIIESKYEIKGNILILPLTGKGDCHLRLDDVRTHIVLTGEPKMVDGLAYLHLQNLNVNFETSRLHMNFENLYSQQKELGDNLNNFLNENWQDIHAEIYPAVKKGLEIAFTEIASRLLAKVPFDDIFLP